MREMEERPLPLNLREDPRRNHGLWHRDEQRCHRSRFDQHGEMGRSKELVIEDYMVLGRDVAGGKVQDERHERGVFG